MSNSVDKSKGVMAAIGTAIISACSAITTLFHAAENAATVVDELSGWAADESASFRKEASVERQKRLALMEAEFQAATE